jgi:hypothetical protein
MKDFVSAIVHAGLGAEQEKGGNVRVEIGKEERLDEAYQSIMKAGSSAGCQVRFVSRSARSLEDLFLEVIVAQEKTGRASVSVVTGGAAAPDSTGGADAPGSKGGKT